MQNHVDLAGIDDLIVRGNHQHTVAVVAAGNTVGRIGDPFTVRNELIFIHAGIQIQSDAPHAVAALGHLVGAGAPVVHGACQIHTGSGSVLIAEGYGGAVDLRADNQTAFPSGHSAGILAFAVSGSGGLDPDFTVCIQCGVIHFDIGGLIAVEVMEQQAQRLSGSGLIVHIQGEIALGIPLNDLAGPFIAANGGGGSPLPGMGHNAVPAKGIDQMDDDAFHLHTADGAQAAGVAVAALLAAGAADTVSPAVAQSGDGFSVAADALGAGVDRTAAFRAGGVGGHRGVAVIAAVTALGADAVFIAVPGGLSGSILIAVAAGIAGVQGIAILRAGGGNNLAFIAVAQLRNLLDIGMGAGFAGKGLGSQRHAGGLRGHRTGIIAVIAGIGIDRVAQSQGAVAVCRQGEGDLHTAGNKHLVRLIDTAGGIVQRDLGSSGVIALSHIPAAIVAGFDANIAVALEGRGQLAVHKLVCTNVGRVILAGVVRAVDVAKEVVGHRAGAPASAALVPRAVLYGVAVFAVGGNGQIVSLVPLVVPVILRGAGVHPAEDHGAVSGGNGHFVISVTVRIRHTDPGIT